MLDRYLIDVYRHVADSLRTLDGHSTTEATHNQLLVDWLSTANRLPFGLLVDRLSNNISSYLLIDMSVDTSLKECKLCQIRAELYHTFSNKVLHSLPCKRNTFSLLKARKKNMLENLSFQWQGNMPYLKAIHQKMTQKCTTSGAVWCIPLTKCIPCATTALRTPHTKTVLINAHSKNATVVYLISALQRARREAT